MTRSIAFLSDLGVRDEFVGVCHAVMDRIAPGVPVIHIGHGVPPMDIRAGALTLAQAIPYIATDSVVLAVVDPGSGTDRLALAVRTAADRLLVETDAPTKPPPPELNRFPLPAGPEGPLNHPANIVVAYEQLAKLRGLSLAELAAQVEQNFCRLFL